MAIAESQLGQLSPSNITAVSAYSPAASTTTIIRSIVICNTSNSAAKFSIYLDDNGVIYNNTTSLYKDSPIASKTTLIIDSYWPMNNSAGNIAVQTDTANVLTFTLMGMEIT